MEIKRRKKKEKTSFCVLNTDKEKKKKIASKECISREEIEE